MSTDQTETLCVLPWLRLPVIINGPPVWFLPVDTSLTALGSALTPQQQTSLRGILSNYRDLHGKAITRATLVSDHAHPVLKNGSPAPLDALRRAVELFCLSSMAKNRYYSDSSPLANTNSSRFESYYHSFIPGSGFCSIQTRRREGRNLDGGYRHGELHLTVPPQVAVAQQCDTDQAFYKSLHSLPAKSPLRRQLGAAAPMFNAAQRDADFVAPSTEVVLSAGAFDTVFDSPGTKNGLSEKLGKLLGPASTVSLSVSNRWKKRRRAFKASFTRPDEHKAIVRAEAEDWSLTQLWMWEFYRIRSQLIHGDVQDERRQLWPTSAHLVVAAHIFPLALKLLLVRRRLYALTDDDELSLLALEHRLDAFDWAKRVGNQTVWSAVIDPFRFVFGKTLKAKATQYLKAAAEASTKGPAGKGAKKTK